MWKIHFESICSNKINSKYHAVFQETLNNYSDQRAEYRKYFTIRFDGVHAFGYNSTGSEPIYTKFGAL